MDGGASPLRSQRHSAGEINRIGKSPHGTYLSRQLAAGIDLVVDYATIRSPIKL